MIGRLVHKAEFERLLGTRSCARSAHFALHHLPAPLKAGPTAAAELSEAKLSTATAPSCPHPVDDSSAILWLGCVVPKRHARRSVTRSLLKRQMRGAFERHAQRLQAGHWLVRLSAGFAVAQFVSASSPALATAARTELDGLLGRVQPPRRAAAVAPDGR